MKRTIIESRKLHCSLGQRPSLPPLCGSRPDQWVFIWGPTAKEGVNACYQQIVHAIIQGNCGYDIH
ncbi:hypothetical protein KIN20_002698 [Parelaphostrongylus tenuis]|uniref:Uncharacterized protein n=1 Tax=Parelaphostrongylus tenuis TaxID=148309 RepID=A0AAD5LY45_PARTN|nr:hypothetical protein KIN20_002698 [Parelaphostrongylus tenuis]